MAKKTQPATPAKNHRTMRITRQPGEDADQLLAQAALRPSVNAAAIIQTLATVGELDFMAVAEEVASQATKVRDGDLSRAEALLISQAHTLDAIFSNMAQRSARNMGEYLEAADRYMRLALKAQAQCARTLEVLAAMKNPPVVIARQANIAHGPQQVNNGAVPAYPEQNAHARTRTGAAPIPSNELLEASHGERLDSGAQGAASGTDQVLEAVGAVHRPAQ